MQFTSVNKLIEKSLREHWEFAALSNYQGLTLCYKDVARRIAKLHIAFEQCGLEKGDKVAICSRNQANWAVSFLATLTYGAVAVPVLHEFKPGNVQYLVNHSGAKVLFVDDVIWDELSADEMPGLYVVVQINNFKFLHTSDSKFAEVREHLNESFGKKYPNYFGPEDLNYYEDSPEELAMINYTSGSSGFSKGVMIPYRALISNIEFATKDAEPQFKEGMNVVSMLPMAHMYGLVIEFIYPLCNGTAIYWLGKAPTPAALLKAFAEVKPYLLITVPLVMEKIYKSKIKPTLDKPLVKFLLKVPGINNIIYSKVKSGLEQAFGGNVQEFIMGGAALNPEVEKVLKRIKFPYLVGYGMTEACPLLAYEHWTKYVPGSCGKAVDCATVRIDSEDPEHIAGEIQAKGDNITIGYYKNPEASANAFTPDGFLHTGDLGIMDKDGNIFIKGRSKSMILTANGQNVYPEEVEAVVNNQPYVAESVVVDRAGKIVALVYLDNEAVSGDKLDEEAVSDIPEKVRKGANRSLPQYSQIAKVETVLAPFEKTPKMSIKRFLYK